MSFVVFDVFGARIVLLVCEGDLLAYKVHYIVGDSEKTQLLPTLNHTQSTLLPPMKQPILNPSNPYRKPSYIHTNTYLIMYSNPTRHKHQSTMTDMYLQTT
jgi:hypothetical protein